MKINNINEIYYIQKEDVQLKSKTVYAPEFFIDYNVAKKRFKKIINEIKSDLDYIENETECLDCIMISGADEWGKIDIVIYLRSRELNKEIIK